MTNNELQLQRLVDGEMNPEERFTFLELAEAEPERWRDIALSFIESQRLDEDLGDLFAPIESPAPLAIDRAPAGIRRRLSWALAAGLSLSLAFLLGKHQTTSPPAQIVEHSPPTPELAAPAIGPPDYRLIMEKPSSNGETQFIDLPVYKESSLQKSLNPELADGWELHWRTDVLTGELKDGRRVIVPVSLPLAHYQGQ